MGTFDWAVKLAEELIAKNGEAVVITRHETVVDPAKPHLPAADAPTTVDGRAVFLNYNTQEAGKTYAPGSEILRDDKKVLLAASSQLSDVGLNGTITRADGTIFRVIKVKQLDPSGQKILYEVQARR